MTPTTASAFIKLLRPEQWIKNIFVFPAMFFGGKLLDPTGWEYTIIGFFAFCIASSSIYCLNDAIDAKEDKNDPEKRFRPVASGAISPRSALITSALLAVISLVFTMLTLQPQATVIIACYILLNILYCFWLKHLVLIDIMVLALGFELRLMMGGITAEVELSMWIIIMIYLLAFFLALAKRRHELILKERYAKKLIRKSASGYNKLFVDMSLSIIAAVILIAYIIYTIQDEVIQRFDTDRLYITSLFVLCGILRYMQLTVVEEKSGNPSANLYSDRVLQLSIAGWLASFLYIIYG